MNLKRPMFLITYRCNLRCKYCFYLTGDKKYQGTMSNSREELTTNEIKELILEPIRQLGIQEIVISGGEPFMRRDISQVLKYISKMNMRCVLQSNLTMDIDSVLNDSDILNSTDFQISLDGIYEQNDILRGKGNYEKVLTNIRKIIKRCKEENIKPSIQVNSVLTNQNIGSIGSFFKEMKSEEIDIFSFQLLSVNENNLKENILSDTILDELIKNAEKIRAMAAEKGTRVLFFPIDVNKENKEYIKRWYNSLDLMPWHGCTYIEDRIRISPYGDVFSCVEKPFVNLKEINLVEALQDQNYIEFKDRIRTKGSMPECIRCCNYKFC